MEGYLQGQKCGKHLDGGKNSDGSGDWEVSSSRTVAETFTSTVSSLLRLIILYAEGISLGRIHCLLCA